jgi:hypothetical protein
MRFLDIITITKDDLDGVVGTIKSAGPLRSRHGVRQLIIDSSSRETGAKIKDLVSREKNIEYVWQAASGISPAFNHGLKLSDAEWVWFLNGGDNIHGDIDLDALLYLMSKSAADALIFEIELKQSSKRLKHPQLWALWPPITAWIPHPATLTRRRLYEKYGYFNESLNIAMDYEFWIRCFSEDVIVDMISIPLVQFDTTGMSYATSSQVAREALSVIRTRFGSIIKMWIGNGLSVLKTVLAFSKKQ